MPAPETLPWNAAALARCLENKPGLAHALLVRGPLGVGKLAFALALARGLLCEAPAPGGGACGACESCHWFDTGGHPDFRMLEPLAGAPAEEGESAAQLAPARKGSTQISVDQIRELADFIHLSSHRAGTRVVVVHPAEALNVNAANALLKSLEEPPARTCFVLVAHRPNRLPATVRSRCRQIALGVPAESDALAWLAQQGVSDAAVKLAHCGGAPLAVRDRDGGQYWSERREFLRRISEPGLDPLAVAEALRDCAPAHLVEWLQKWSYDLIMLTHQIESRFNPDFSAALSTLAARVDGLAASRFHREMVRLQRIVAHPLNARLFIEQLLIDYAALVAPRRAAA